MITKKVYLPGLAVVLNFIFMSLVRFFIVVCFTLLTTLGLPIVFDKSDAAFLSSCTKLSFYIIGLQVFVWLHASGIIFDNPPTERFYDFTGAITFITSVLLSLFVDLESNSFRISEATAAFTDFKLWPTIHRQYILSLFVLLWAFRLGYFLFARVNRHQGKDSRFEEIRKIPIRFLSAWLLQVIVCLCVLAIE